MKKISRHITTLFLLSFCLGSALAQKLPEGEYHADRDRTYDILHYKAELSFNFENKQLFGKATMQFSPLQKIDSLALDAILLKIKRVSIAESNIDLNYRQDQNKLEIKLPAAMSREDKATVVIEYECSPKAGMYFLPDPGNEKLFFVTTYGENGLHANWLPIYNDVNDKFSSEMVVTVPEPYTVISNGKLIEKKSLANGQTQFHWLEEQPHSNYLIALYIGDFEKGELQPAFGQIPIDYWVPRGMLQEGEYAFRNTTKMVEFFSNRLDYRYPWYKYDQVAVPDYAIGAMEHTTVTGHRASVLRTETAPLDFSPTLEYYTDPWTAEATISHELAHHWFGDNLTCRNLSTIWLNESFASYLMMLWDEESLGQEQLLFDVDLAKQQYFDYVRDEHIIRPLEYHYFDDANTIYNTEHTYYKGAVILHSLRQIMGDEPFFHTLSNYMHQHEFGNVDSHDFQIAIEEASGENLDWFFEQWVTGGGHPQLEVSYDYLADSKKIALRAKQVQPLVEGQGIFELPATITIATPEKTWPEKIWLDEDDQRFVFDSAQKPIMVSLDGEGDLVAEIDFPKDATELAYQALNDAIPGRLRAIRELAAQHPGAEQTIETFRKILTKNGFWGVKAEAALQLGTIRTPAAESLTDVALQSDDYRVRKATVLALAKLGAPSALQKMQQIVSSDPQNDVVATAIVALAKTSPNLGADFIQKQMARDSWYDEIRIAALKACEVLRNAELVSIVKQFIVPKYNQSVQEAALHAWAACAPTDKQLHRTLIDLTESPTYSVQQTAIQMLGDLYVIEAKNRLNQIIEENVDANLTVAAETALEKIEVISIKN